MAGISVQTKNASYYGAINKSKKNAIGVVGAYKGKYAKKTPSSQTIRLPALSTKKSQSVQTNKKKLLEDIKKQQTQKTNPTEQSDKEITDLTAAQMAAEENETSEEAAEKNKASEETAEHMEEMKKAGKQVVFVETSVYKKNGYPDLTKTSNEKKETKVKKKLYYSYKDVSFKIQQAKTSLSAGQAVISAKRKVMELRRKASSGNTDSEELQLALSHAKKMEMIAKRKKRNLELEEMVEQVKAQDERAEKAKEGYGDAQNDVVEAAKVVVEQAQEDIANQRDKYAEELSAEAEKMLEEFGQEEMEMLEETMEMLEQLEAVNPHMSDEKFEELKRKHRASEDKALNKANMEYLKGMMKQLEKESHKSSVATSSPQACTYSPASVTTPMATISVPAGVEVDVEC